uniref:Uncharacterized protein n=1 Tax=Arundo donax TaxID=35708 RepID=A0A0A8Z0D4_ARUDO
MKLLCTASSMNSQWRRKKNFCSVSGIRIH